MYFYPSSSEPVSNYQNPSLAWLGLAFVLQWNLSNGTPSNQGTLPFRGQKIWSRKNVRIIFVSVTSTEGAPLFRRKEQFKPRFSLYSGDTLAFKTWPTTNRVDTSKSTLITTSLKSTICTCENSTHNIAYFALCSCFDYSRFWGRIKNIYFLCLLILTNLSPIFIRGTPASVLKIKGVP